MILKSFNVEKNQSNIKNFKAILIYGENGGLRDNIKELIKKGSKEGEYINFFQDEIIKNDKNVKYFNYLDKDKFYKQIKYLKKNYEIIDPLNKEKYLKKKNKKLCWLTFDDGYIDHYHNVLPILNKFNLKGFNKFSN